MKKRFPEEQIVSILRESESGDKSVAELARQHGVSEPTIYGWKRKLAERDVEIDVIREFLKKK
jgi:putative transposase